MTYLQCTTHILKTDVSVIMEKLKLQSAAREQPAHIKSVTKRSPDTRNFARHLVKLIQNGYQGTLWVTSSSLISSPASVVLPFTVSSFSIAVYRFLLSFCCWFALQTGQTYYCDLEKSRYKLTSWLNMCITLHLYKPLVNKLQQKYKI